MGGKKIHFSPGQVPKNFNLACYKITCPCQAKINSHIIFYLSVGHWVKT